MPTASRYSCSKRACVVACRGSTRRRSASSASSNSASRPFLSRVGAGGDRRPVAPLEVLAVVARVLEGGDLERRRARACATRRGRRTARARAPRRPTAAAAARRAAAAARTGPSCGTARRSSPRASSSAAPIVPPGRQTRTSSSATSWWCGANIAPIEDITTSKDSSSNGRFSASASTQSSSTPSASRAGAAGVEQLGREVAGGHRARRAAAAGIEALPVPAATSRTRMPGADRRMRRRAAGRAAAGTSRPSTGSRRTPTSCDGGPSARYRRGLTSRVIPSLVGPPTVTTTRGHVHLTYSDIGI